MAGETTPATRARDRREGSADAALRSKGDDARRRGAKPGDGAKAKDTEVRASSFSGVGSGCLKANNLVQPAKSIPVQEKSEADKKDRTSCQAGGMEAET